MNLAQLQQELKDLVYNNISTEADPSITYFGDELGRIIDEFVRTNSVEAINFRGSYDASSNTPNLDSPPTISISNGDTWKVTNAGTFYTESIVEGTMLIAASDSPTTLSEWIIIEDPTQIIIDNQGPYRLITGTSTYDKFQSYSNLLFDGVQLTVGGDLEVGNDIFVNNLKEIGGSGIDIYTSFLRINGVINIDDIHEFTLDQGVSIDGVLIKDGEIDWSYISNTPTTLAGYGISDTMANFDIALSDGSFAYAGGAYHDGFSDYIANEHIDWTNTTESLLTTGNISTDGEILTDVIKEYTTSAGVTIQNNIYIPGISGSGTGTSMLYYNRSTGAVTYADAPGGGSSDSLIYTETIIDNSTTNITVGNTSSDIGIKIYFSIIRASQYQTGSILLVYKGGTSISVDSDFFGDDLGVYFTADISGSDIRINAIATNTTQNATMEYSISYFGGLNIWNGEGSFVSTITLPGGGETNEVVVGTVNEHIAIRFQYGLSRATNYQVGEVILLNKGGTLDLSNSYVGDNCGINFISYVNNGYIVLRITTDGSSDEGILDYKLIYPDGDRSWNSPGGMVNLTKTFSSGSSNQVLLGSVKDIRGSKIVYTLSRGTNYQVGEIEVVHDGASVSINREYVGDNCGETITGDIVNGLFIVRVVMDSSDASSSSFYYQALDFNPLPQTSYVHPNHVGQVTSVGDGTTTLHISAITDQIELVSGLVSTDELLVNDAGILKRMDISILQDYMQSNLTFGGSSYWTRSGTDLSPATVGDDLLLPDNDRIYWGSKSMYLYGDTSGVTDTFYFYAENTQAFVLSTTNSTLYSELVPGSNKVYSLGNSSTFWQYGYFDRIYIDNINTYIDISANDMVFTDINSGTVTLASLIGSGPGYWSRIGTSLSPTTSGDDILLAVSTERILFGDEDTYIYESADDVLSIYTGGRSNAKYYFPSGGKTDGECSYSC